MSEWKELPIADVADTYAGGTPSRGRTDYFNGNIPWVSSSEVNLPYIVDTKEKITQLGLENSSAKWIPKNSVLIAMYGATAGVVSKLLIDATSNQAVLALVPKKELIYGDFLYYQVKENKEAILYLAQGSGQPNLSKDLIDNFIIRLPNSLHTQSKIAHILSTADAVIEKTQAAIAKYKAIKQGMLHDLFTRGIDLKTGKLRPRYEDAPELYKESKLGWIPREWEVEMLEKNCEINPLAYLPGNLKADDEVTFLKMEDVSNDAEIINYNTRKVKDVSKRGFTPFIEDDILFAKITPCMENGKGALAKGLKNGFGFGSTEFHVLRALNEKSIHFLFYLTTSVEFRLKAEGKMSGSAGQQRVPTSFFQEYKIPLPSIDEQFEIGVRIDTINQKLQTEQTYLHKLQQFKAGLMGDLLSGRVKVSESQMEGIKG